MISELERRFEALEEQRAALQNRVLALTDAQRRWTPSDSVWSIAQIVQHLVLSDETVGRAQAADEVARENLMFRALPRAVRRALVLSALRRDVVLPLPSPSVEPREDVPLPTLLSRWEAARVEMRRALDTMQWNERRYSHPVLGPLTGAQMLDLALVHKDYHKRQMETLQREEAFPTKDKMED